MRKKYIKNIVIIILGIILLLIGIFLYNQAYSIIKEQDSLRSLVQLLHDGKIDGLTWTEISNTINNYQIGISSNLSNISWMAIAMFMIGIILICIAIINFYFEKKWDEETERLGFE